jgi:hypothetical protein
MTAFNPIASMQRLEAAGFKRAQAEALADELRDATSDLVTNEHLTFALDAQTDKFTRRMDALDERLALRMDALEEKLTLRIDALEDKLTLRICGILGGLLTLGFAAVGLAIALS